MCRETEGLTARLTPSRASRLPVGPYVSRHRHVSNRKHKAAMAGCGSQAEKAQRIQFKN